MKNKKAFFIKNIKYTILTIFAIFAIGPLIWLLISAFKSNSQIFSDPFSLPSGRWQWENFQKAWIQGNFGIYFWNTVVMTVPSVFLTVLFSTMAGYSIARFSKNKANRITFSGLLIGMTIPLQALMIPLFHNFVRLNIVDTMSGLIISLVAVHLPFGVFLMRSFFMDLPDNIAEAAKIDGCSEYSVFWKIMLPQAKSGIMALLAIEFMNTWKAFLLPLLLIHTDTKRPLTLGLMFFNSSEGRHYNLLAAGVIISAIPVILIFLAANRHFEKGLSAGSFR